MKYFPIVRHVGCFQFGDFINNTTINIQHINLTCFSGNFLGIYSHK